VAKYEIEISDAVPADFEAIAFRKPRRGELFISDDGRLWDADAGESYPPRLIVRKKEVAKTVRPYNAEEMRNLYIGRARLVSSSECHDVIGYDSGIDAIRIDGLWWNAIELRGVWKHLDGSRCEVIE